MYSTASEDLSRDHLALQVTNCLSRENIGEQSKRDEDTQGASGNKSFNYCVCRREQKSPEGPTVESCTPGKEFSGSCPNTVREIVQIMSNLPASPRKRSNPAKTYSIQTYKEDNNNASNKFSDLQQARAFISWYKRMIDHDRQNFGLYLSDDAVLEWFGRTIKTRKKVTSFLRYDMQCSRHDFTTIESIEKVQLRHERIPRKEDTVLASPLHSPELLSSKKPACKRVLRSNCNSPEWAEGCQPEELKNNERKPLKRHIDTLHDGQHKVLKRGYPEDPDISNKGDGLIDRPKRKCLSVTPPNHELGQGDCMPSTSSNNTTSHETLNAQLPKLAVECNGYIEFTRTRNNRSSDSMKWERKCKVQVSYSVDPLNVGEYIIWALHYIDETKCRRNLLAAFEEVAREDESRKIK